MLFLMEMRTAAYFDASGHKESPALVVAGFESTTVSWSRFERDWKFCLAWYGVSALHMKDFTASWREFASWRVTNHDAHAFWAI
jgi:hypothetical protein